jgi:hypothetical protein
MSSKMTEDEALQTVQDLLGGRETTKNAPAMRDRLIEVAGDKTKLVKLMDAVSGLPKELTEEK